MASICFSSASNDRVIYRSWIAIGVSMHGSWYIIFKQRLFEIIVSSLAINLAINEFGSRLKLHQRDDTRTFALHIIVYSFIYCIVYIRYDAVSHPMPCWSLALMFIFVDLFGDMF